jgi:lipopolysaccharide biosynthesis regulator YciM
VSEKKEREIGFMWPQFWQWFSDPSNQKILLSVAVGVILGLVVSRLINHLRRNKPSRVFTGEGDQAFFKGIQYILSNDPDLAIEEFTKAVQINSDTIETYVALGNLYRSKGNIEKAIRIRQSIILRPHLDGQIKLGALVDLGQDYRKGGFLARALEIFREVLQKEPSHLEALRAVEKICVEMRDWETAFETRQRIARLAKEEGSHSHILAHYQTEMGKVFLSKGDSSKAKSSFQKALSIDETCVDACLHLGDLHFQKGEYKKAMGVWKRVTEVAPQFTFLAYKRLEGAYANMDNLKPVEQFLRECAKSNADAFTHMALARYLYNEGNDVQALRELDSALELDPSYWEARRFKGEILLKEGMSQEALSAYRDLLAHLNVPYLKFQCINCGFKPSELQWQCPQCKAWDTIQLVDVRRMRSGTETNLPETKQADQGQDKAEGRS